MKKTCSVDRKCLSFSLRFSLPARCKFIVLIFKINFLWFWPLEPEKRFPRFSENKALFSKTNHIRFLALSIPNYMQNTKEIDFSTTYWDFAWFLLKVALNTSVECPYKQTIYAATQPGLCHQYFERPDIVGGLQVGLYAGSVLCVINRGGKTEFWKINCTGNTSAITQTWRILRNQGREK